MALDGVQRIPDVLQHRRKRLPVVFSEGDTERRFSELPLKARLPQRQGLECPRDDTPLSRGSVRASPLPSSAHSTPRCGTPPAHQLDSSATATTACPSI